MTVIRKGWVEALPIGNGRMGAMIFGGIAKERIQLNEESLWAGYAHDENNPNAAAALPMVRKWLFEGRDDSATVLADKAMMGIPKRVSPYQTMGDIWMEFDGILKEKTSDYYRDLNLDQALTTVRFVQDGRTFTREAFASHPDNIIAMRLTASAPGSISFTMAYTVNKMPSHWSKTINLFYVAAYRYQTQQALTGVWLLKPRYCPFIKAEN
jgi:alpha-L-fucosidase 2